MTDTDQPVELAPATKADVEWARSLLRGTGLPVADLPETPADGDITLYVVEAEPGAVGCIGLEQYGHHGLLRSAVVQEAHRGEGYGRAAVRALESEARDAGVGTLFLLTTTAATFFADLGYERVDRNAVPDAVRQSAEFSDLCPSSAVAMCRRL